MSALPEGWAETTLGELGTWSSGGTPSKSTPSFWEGTLPWVSPKDLKTDFVTDSIDHISEAGLEAAKLKLLPPGTLLFVVRGMILARAFPVALTRVPVTTNQDIRALTPAAGIDSEYLFRALQNEAHRILHSVKEATHGTLRLDSDQLQRWPILLAPLAEQRRIVEKVEALLASIDYARDRLGAGLRSIQKLRRSVIAKACSGELTRSWAEVNISSETRPWLIKRLGDVFRVATGATPLRKNLAYYQNGDVPWVRSGAVNESTITLPDEYITALAVKETNTKVFAAGTLLIAMYGEGATRGKVAELGIDAATNQALAAIVFDHGNESLRPFLKLFLGNRYNQSREDSAGGVQPNLSLQIIRDIEITIPSASEQAEILRRVNVLMHLLEAAEKRVTDALSAADRLPATILSKAFAGRLVPTEAELARKEGRSYEAAPQLLERVRKTYVRVVRKSAAHNRKTQQPTSS